MRKAFELVAYATIGVVLVAVVLVIAVFRPDISFSEFHMWSSFVFFTVLLGTALTKMYWPVRKVKKVWLLLALFMAAHIAGYLLFRRNVQDLPTFAYIFTTPLEVMLFATIACFGLKVNPPLSKGPF